MLKRPLSTWVRTFSDRIDEPLFKCQVALLGILFICSPLASGGQLLWARGLLVLGTALVFSVWLIRRSLSSSRMRVRFDLFFGLVLLLAVYQVFQLIPMGNTLAWFSPVAETRWSGLKDVGVQADSMTISLLPEATFECLVLTLCIAAIYFVAVNTFTTRKRLFVLGWLVVGASSVNALVALFSASTGERKLFWYVSDRGTYALVGTFVNANHFALLMEMGVLVLAGVGMAVLYRTKKGRTGDVDKDKTIHQQRVAGITATVMLMLTILMGLLFSYSRTGIAVGLTGLLILGMIAMKRRSGTELMWLTGGGIGAFLIVGMRGLFHIWREYVPVLESETATMAGRFDMWESSLALIQDYWKTGAGMGAFRFVSPHYESGFKPGSIAYHAHNDWVELFCELGIPFGALLIIGLAVFFFGRIRALIRQNHRTLQWLGLGGLMAVIAVVCHEFFDYGLRNPGNLVVFCGALVLFVNSSTWESKRSRPKNRERKKRKTSKRLWVVPFTIGTAGIVLAPAALYAYKNLNAGIPLVSIYKQQAIPDTSLGMSATQKAQYLVDQAERVLAFRPRNFEALKARAYAHSVLGKKALEAAQRARGNESTGTNDNTDTQGTQTAIAKGNDTDDKAVITNGSGRPEILRKEAREHFRSAITDYRMLCRIAPTNGEMLAKFARATERLGQLQREIPEERIEKLYRLAHDAYPQVGLVTRMASEGVWSSVWRRDVSQEQREKLVKRALNLFERAIAQTPRSARDVYDIVWDKLPVYPVLKNITPDYVTMHEELYKFLFDRGRTEQCLEQLAEIKRINKENRDRADKEQTLFEKKRIASRSYAEIRSSVLRRKALLLGILERWDERAKVMERLSEALAPAVEEKLTKAQTWIDQGQLAQAQLALEQARKIDPVNTEALLLSAEAGTIRGKQKQKEDALLMLLMADRTRSIEHLSEALQLCEEAMNQPSAFDKESSFPVWRFLRAGFLFRLSERLAATQPNTTLKTNARQKVENVLDTFGMTELDAGALRKAALKELSFIHAGVKKGDFRKWIQYPSVCYLAGRAHEAENQPIEAFQAYNDALADCRRHAYSARRMRALLAEIRESPATVEKLAGLGVDKVQEALEATEWLPDERMEIPLHSNFGGLIELVGVEFAEGKVTRGDPIEVTFLWRCHGNIRQEYRIDCKYRSKGTTIFVDRFRAGKTDSPDMVTWRIGEVTRMTRNISPTALTARQTTTLPSGQYNMEVSLIGTKVNHKRLRPLVKCLAPAFQLVSRKQATRSNNNE